MSIRHLTSARKNRNRRCCCSDGGSNAAFDVVGVGIYNADTTSDILFRNATSGAIGYLAVTSAGAAGNYVSLGTSNTAYGVV